MTDRTTKALLFAIALGLWMHIAGDWLRPTPLQAQAKKQSLSDIIAMSDIEMHLKHISVDTSTLALGTTSSEILHELQALRRDLLLRSLSQPK